jgi:hypothetical protein
VHKMPAEYDEYEYQNAVNPKSRTPQFGDLKGAAFVAAMKDLPTWQGMQELGEWVQPVETIITFLHTETEDIDGHKMKHDVIAAELTRIG